MAHHQKSPKRSLCYSFDDDEEIFEAHLPRLDMHSCPECKQRFPYQASLETHQRDSRHAYCDDCGVISPTKQLHVRHMQLHPAIEFRCCDCHLDFENEDELTNHIRRVKIHRLRNFDEESSRTAVCKKCRRTFKNQKSLEQHLASVRHKPLSEIKCVATTECEKTFNCPSAQFQHLESGRCVSGMTKEKFNKTIACHDTNRVITSGGISPQWLEDDNLSPTSTSLMQSPILTPTSTEFVDSYPSSTILTPAHTPTTSNLHTILAPQPRDVQVFQKCPICPPSCTRIFGPGALQQHLSSGKHGKLLSLPVGPSFHCPRALVANGTYIKQFSTVSALAQHIESGACGGKETFRRAMDYIQEEMENLGLGGMKLI